MQTIKQAINPAFLRQPTNREEIELFKKEFIKLYDRINKNETEEFHKNLIKDFLNEVYYKDKHYINTKGKNDLVIHNDKETTSPVGALIETKSPTNKTEMPSIGRDEINRVNTLNVKSFHELLLYYLRERKTGKNFELRHLIITNVYEWFVFDAQDFEKLFYQNKTLLNLFEQFEAGNLSGKTTDFFYKEIAAPQIEKLQSEIPFTHFDLRNYATITNKGACPLAGVPADAAADTYADEKELIALYKFLSPTHLLKLPFSNDANQLNKEFYTELLHIIGLEEVTQEGKKLIVRKKEKERDGGSIIENAISAIVALDKLNNIDTLQYGENSQEQLFTVALELAITWINRILFLKLLEAQIIKYQNGNKDYRFLSTEMLSDYNEVNALFFRVLACKENERNDSVKTKFANVPYLNSSLFEKTELEDKILFISNLQNNILIKLFLKSVLIYDGLGRLCSGGSAGALQSQFVRPLEYLLNFLDAYDFSSEGTEKIQEINKPLISASVLGLIFEKINGYKDGSFFTPSFITMYMCRETISRAVIQKFNESLVPSPSPKEKGEDASLGGGLGEVNTIEEVHNLIPKIGIERANKIFNQLRICDPAVGSGHFLVSALNEMIYLKSELGILADKNGKTLWNYTVTVENDELIIKNPDGDFFTYDPKNAESQRIQETFFHEKQTIIENCLFGVDINPNSVKICQLRLWIELLKHSYYTNAGALQTLPNIDINIKCGNSLMSRFALDDKYADNSALKNNVRQATKRYKEWVFLYKQCDNKEAKRQYAKNIEAEKDFYYRINNSYDRDFQNLQKAKNELDMHTQSFNYFETETDNYNEKVTQLTEKLQNFEKIYNDKIRGCFEWRFEFPEVLDDDGNFVGFDVVVGNPPYVFLRSGNMTELEKKYYRSTFNLYNLKPRTDIYFYEKGVSLIKENGFLSFISPKNMLTVRSLSNFRKYFLTELGNISIVNILGKVFENANVDTMIAIFQKSKANIIKCFTLNVGNVSEIVCLKKEIFLNGDNLINFDMFKNPEISPIIDKIEKSAVPLKEFIEISNGLVAYKQGNGTPVQTKEMAKERVYHSYSKVDENWFSYLGGSDVKRYTKNWSGEFIQYGKNLGEPRRIELFNKPHIIVRVIPSQPPYCINGMLIDKEIFNDQNYIVLFGKDEFDLKWILGVINSRLISFWFEKKLGKLQRGLFPQMKAGELAEFPIPNISADQQQTIISLVDQILSAKKENPSADTRELEREIDLLVYGLYGVTEGEVEIIENK